MSSQSHPSFAGAFVLLVWWVAAPGFAQNAPLNPAAYDHPVRVAMIGDSITFGSGTTVPLGRGAPAIRGATLGQQTAAADLAAATAALSGAVEQARLGLLAASLRGSADRAALQAGAEGVADAELRLALARADGLARIQASREDRFNAVQLAEFAQYHSPDQVVRAGGGPGEPPVVATIPNLRNSYPDQLARMLGPKWEVRNFGISGATLLKKGDRPYWNEPAFQAALDFNPEVVVIMLGTNDSKPQNWKFAAEFESDYKEMIARFAALPSRPRIWITQPMPAFSSAFAISESVIAGEEIPLIAQIARTTGVGLIDQYEAMKPHAGLVPDGIHPNADGARFLALTVHATLTGQPAPAAQR